MVTVEGYNVFRFLDVNDDTLFVGHTQYELKNRMNVIYAYEFKLWMARIARCEYITCSTISSMISLSQFFQHRFKPKYNTMPIQDAWGSLELLKPPVWELLLDIDTIEAYWTKMGSIPYPQPVLKLMWKAAGYETKFGKIENYTFVNTDKMNDKDTIRFMKIGQDFEIIKQFKSKL